MESGCGNVDAKLNIIKDVNAIINFKVTANA